MIVANGKSGSGERGSQSKGHPECVKVSGEKQEVAQQSADSDRQPVYLIQKTISGVITFHFHVVENQFLVGGSLESP